VFNFFFFFGKRFVLISVIATEITVNVQLAEGRTKTSHNSQHGHVRVGRTCLELRDLLTLDLINRHPYSTVLPKCAALVCFQGFFVIFNGSDSDRGSNIIQYSILGRSPISWDLLDVLCICGAWQCMS